ncbi:transcriptional regulator with XRE-family HTH domain [Spirosoma lacussanchae]|uniref:helix-turn-helix domain-containing protein n=1 Tax=Spirosoma lacussanchae TaxID=1884249 RepID=UPI003D216493
MQHEINVNALGEAIQRHREDKKLTVRAAAEQMESVSPSTLSRIERGSLPDLDTYMRICRWLNVDPAHFATEPIGKTKSERKPELMTEDIIVHLRADKLLNVQTRDALITMIEVAYAASRRNVLPNEAQSIPSGV